MGTEAGVQEQTQNLMRRKEFEEILKQIAIPRYGSITIVIHDGRIVQIEKNEKFRLYESIDKRMNL